MESSQLVLTDPRGRYPRLQLEVIEDMRVTVQLSPVSREGVDNEGNSLREDGDGPEATGLKGRAGSPTQVTVTSKPPLPCGLC